MVVGEVSLNAAMPLPKPIQSKIRYRPHFLTSGEMPGISRVVTVTTTGGRRVTVQKHREPFFTRSIVTSSLIIEEDKLEKVIERLGTTESTTLVFKQCPPPAGPFTLACARIDQKPARWINGNRGGTVPAPHLSLIERGFGLASVTARSLERRRWSVVHFPASPSHCGTVATRRAAIGLPPDATFGKGAKDMASIREVTQARDNFSQEQSTR
jgi:hypothetical protein